MKKSQLVKLIIEEIDTYNKLNNIIRESKTAPIKWGTPNTVDEFVKYSKQFSSVQRNNAWKIVNKTFLGTKDLTKTEKAALVTWIKTGKHLSNLLFAEPLANTLYKLYGKK